MIQQSINLYTLRSNSNRSQLCEKQSKLLHDGIHNAESWAERMIDTSAKLPNGINKIHKSDVGYFDDCIHVRNDSLSIKGKYCLTTIIFYENELCDKNKTDAEKLPDSQDAFAKKLNSFPYVHKINWAICVPDGCTASELQDHLNTFAGGDIFRINESQCQTIETYRSKLRVGDWLVVTFLIMSGVVILTSTFYDLYLNYTQAGTGNSIIIAFSLFTNFQKLNELKHRSDSIHCLKGIRVISLLWIMYGYQYELAFSILCTNLVDTYNWLRQFSSILVRGRSIYVDTFFLLNGCLLMYDFLKLQAQKISFNLPYYYLSRFVRLTPSYAAAILFKATLYRFMGSGPLWDPENTNEPCKIFWWNSLLYFQNYVTDDACVDVNWYLQIDMQLYFVTPIVFLTIEKWPRLTIYLLSTLALVFISIPAIVWKYNLVALKYGDVLNAIPINPVFEEIYYTQAYTRAYPWTIGLLLGHILFYTRNKKRIANKILLTFLWIFSIVSMAYILFGYYNGIKLVNEYNQQFSSIFIGLHRLIWSLVLSWVIFACVHGYGGPINWFLSLPIFQLLSRLTYAMLLLHFPIQFIHQRSLQTPYIFSNSYIWYVFCGTFVTTLLVSILWTLIFESPYLALNTLLSKLIGPT